MTRREAELERFAAAVPVVSPEPEWEPRPEVQREALEAVFDWPEPEHSPGPDCLRYLTQEPICSNRT